MIKPWFLQVYKLMEDTWKWEPDDRPTFEEITQRLENMFSSSSVEEGLFSHYVIWVLFLSVVFIGFSPVKRKYVHVWGPHV